MHILNSFNISGMDEATLFKFGKWVECGRVYLRGEKVSLNLLSGSRDAFKKFRPL